MVKMKPKVKIKADMDRALLTYMVGIDDSPWKLFMAWTERSAKSKAIREAKKLTSYKVITLQLIDRTNRYSTKPEGCKPIYSWTKEYGKSGWSLTGEY